MEHPKNFNLRPATEQDLIVVVEIYNEVLKTSTATFEETPRELEEFTSAFHDKKQRGIPWIVAELDGAVVGYGTYGGFRKASGYRTTVEHSLHIDSRYRGKGLGSAILKNLIHEARKKNIHAMIAGLDASNGASIALHEKFGFKKVGEIPQVAKKFSRWLDLVLMQLILD